ncbi:MAG: energy transducer TonB, partial [Acidobacteria bacterium]|nr:energy transducer TonB [Acidobacteriota bacterium]
AVVRPQPGYPPLARQGRVQGTVLVRVVVDETGKVIEAEPVCGPRALQEASVQSAKKWKFTPTLLDGVPVRVSGTIRFNFVLQ